MIAIIPAAGMSRRLRPLTDHTPKCLLDIGGSTMLDRTLQALRLNDITETIIVTGYLHEQIEEHIASHPHGQKITIVHNPRYNDTNNIYSLRLAADAVPQGVDVLLLDSDIIFDPQIITRLLQASYPNTLALVHHTLSDEEIKCRIDDHGLISEISKTVAIDQAIGESVGIEKMSAPYFAALADTLRIMTDREGQDNIFYEKAFERLIPQGLTFKPIDVTDLKAMEVDTPEDLQAALHTMQ